jgi:hypothetical protein
MRLMVTDGTLTNTFSRAMFDRSSRNDVPSGASGLTAAVSTPRMKL